MKLQPIDILADDEHGGIFLKVTAQRGGRSLDTVLAEAIRFDAMGRWSEYWALAENQDMIDSFWREAS